ncbi:FadR/GntR family transcriptional regulator [Pseudomonas aeruginosa]|uniref:FadR/GntR family transcriptional regulator n=1 Tax=Pseudomonas aeruginosa TaxID=287 RepID=UPI003B3C729E
MRPATRLTLADSVITILKENIAKGVWRVGDKLPIESELAELLGVGRNTVREAIRTLAYGGILEVRQGNGTFVRRAIDPADTMRSVDRAAQHEHLELQCVLEAECARFAARRRTAADLKTLRKLLAARGERDSAGDISEFVERDRAFHIAIAEATHNQALEALYRYFSSAIQSNVTGILTEFEEAEIPEPGLEAHRLILDAIERQDEEAAVQATLSLLTPQVEWVESRQKAK